MLDSTTDLPGPDRATSAKEIALLKSALHGEYHAIVDMGVTTCVPVDQAVALGIPLGRQRTVTVAYDELPR